MYVDSNFVNSGLNNIEVDAPSPSNQAWHHYVATYDGDRTDLYVDAFMVGAVSTGPIMYANDSFFIGCDLDNGTATARFTGYLDNVRFYGRVLSPSEIAALTAL